MRPDLCQIVPSRSLGVTPADGRPAIGASTVCSGHARSFQGKSRDCVFIRKDGSGHIPRCGSIIGNSLT
jgi:hypothetical protein